MTVFLLCLIYMLIRDAEPLTQAWFSLMISGSGRSPWKRFSNLDIAEHRRLDREAELQTLLDAKGHPPRRKLPAVEVPHEVDLRIGELTLP